MITLTLDRKRCFKRELERAKESTRSERIRENDAV